MRLIHWLAHCLGWNKGRIDTKFVKDDYLGSWYTVSFHICGKCGEWAGIPRNQPQARKKPFQLANAPIGQVEGES